jgi:benzodiazapine receptor
MDINWPLIIGLIIACNLIGALGALWTSPQSSWYENIKKPSFQPPSKIVGPVWTLLFTLMGIALYIVWVSPPSQIKTIAITFFVIQFIFNLLWSYLFFGINNPLWAFIDIMILLVFILITGIYFYQINKYSGYLLIPYVFWVAFASFINYSIWELNS